MEYHIPKRQDRGLLYGRNAFYLAFLVYGLPWKYLYNNMLLGVAIADQPNMGSTGKDGQCC